MLLDAFFLIFLCIANQYLSSSLSCALTKIRVNTKFPKRHLGQGEEDVERRKFGSIS